MCKATQSYLPYLTAAGSGALPLNLGITPCASYMLAYNSACATRGFPPTEATLFDVSHCPSFKLAPVFVGNRDFVVLDFASLPEANISEKGDSPTKNKAQLKEIEILSPKSKGEWVESPIPMSSSVVSPLSGKFNAGDASLVSPMTPRYPKTPMTPRTIGNGMMSPKGVGNVAMSPTRIAGCGTQERSKRLNLSGPRMEGLKEEDEMKLGCSWRKVDDVIVKEV